MNGVFEVKKEKESYIGLLSHQQYHGHGKLTNHNGTFEGEFKEGKLMQSSHGGSKNGRAGIMHSSMTEFPSHSRKQPMKQDGSVMINKMYDQPVHNSYYGENNGEDRYMDGNKSRYRSYNKAKESSSDMMEFSYPFGHQLP